MSRIPCFVVTVCMIAISTGCNDAKMSPGSVVDDSIVAVTVVDESTVEKAKPTAIETPLEVVQENLDGSQEIQYPVTRFVLEQRTRTVPVQRKRTEQITRMSTDDDGKETKETYSVEVPYTEAVEQIYTINGPVQEVSR